tara:strand:- start:397 stop:1023 length:627 start_codon:yes stop_codon:yes gene_type:complete
MGLVNIMKLKRSQLKELIKECLNEMFAEEFVATVIQTKLDEFVQIQLRESISQATQQVQTLVTPAQPQQQYFAPSQTNLNRQQMLREVAPDIHNTATSPQQRSQLPIVQPNDLDNRMSQFKQTLNNINNHGEARLQNNQQQAHQQIAESVDSSSNMMQSIFADTAATTLRKQDGADRPGLGPGTDPTDPGIDISRAVNPNWKIMAGLA